MNINKYLIFLFISIFLINLVGSESNLCEGNYISIDLSYDGNFSVLNKTLEKGCVPDYKHFAGFRYSYNLTGKNETIYSADFNPTLIFSDGILENFTEENISGSVGEMKTEFSIFVPSTRDAENVELYDGDLKILEINIYDVGATSCRVS
ncbi:MAG: hypothetical protein PHC28_01305 [Flavobacterium sp.]|uniref:hypothetical protein n=1 Tax=Flavobacterium sp. TaxID=239 RepID=UPI00262AC376|nr:hypothetical protein [Flavobacterium sp.]MDD5149105.1 hypothetical protein [Flavobacterium sp.]